MPERQGRGRLNWLHRIAAEKILAKERGEEISDEEARRRVVARLHRPKLKRLYNENCCDGEIYDPRLYAGTEVALTQGKIALPNCIPLEPEAVHAGRDYEKISREVARMIEEGRAQPEEIRFMCGEFFIWVHNGEDFLIRFGERRIPYRINKDKVRVSHEHGTVTIEGHPPIRLKSVAIFEYYLTLYDALCSGWP